MGPRSRALIEQSRALIAKGRARIGQTQRRIVLMINGGSIALAERQAPPSFAEPVIPRINGGRIPRIYGGRSKGGTTCSSCGRTIAPAALEYEVELETETFLLDRECFVREEAKNFGLPVDGHE
jgi:hypothetical protein